MGCEKNNAVRRRGTNHLPKHRDIQKLRCSKGLQARAAIERDAPNPSESGNQPCYLACPGCSRNGELPRRAGCLGADETERKGSHHGEGNKDHDDEGSRLQVGGRPLGGAVGQHGARAWAARTAEREQVSDRAPAVQRLGDQADARAVGGIDCGRLGFTVHNCNKHAAHLAAAQA